MPIRFSALGHGRTADDAAPVYRTWHTDAPMWFVLFASTFWRWRYSDVILRRFHRNIHATWRNSKGPKTSDLEPMLEGSDCSRPATHAKTTSRQHVIAGSSLPGASNTLHWRRWRTCDTTPKHVISGLYAYCLIHLISAEFVGSRQSRHHAQVTPLRANRLPKRAIRHPFARLNRHWTSVTM